MTLASPGRGSGRVIPPSVFPVVPAQRARLGLRKPTGRPPGPRTLDAALFGGEPTVDRAPSAQAVGGEVLEDRPQQVAPTPVSEPAALRPVVADPPAARPARAWWRLRRQSR